MEKTPHDNPDTFWVEWCDVLDRSQSGEFVVGGENVAGYRKPEVGSVATYLHVHELPTHGSTIELIESRRGPFTEIRIAKVAIESICVRNTR